MPHADPEERRAYMRAYKKAHRERIRALNQESYDRHRDEIAARRAARRAADPDTYRAKQRTIRARNIETVRQQMRASSVRYRRANPERAKAAHKRYLDADPLRARAIRLPGDTRRRQRLKDAKAAAVGRIDLKAIVARDGGRCHLCGKLVAAADRSFDHLIPLSLGGPHTQDNLRLAHKRCNSKRGAGRIPAQMLLPLGS
jgi:5-methylcytosine-specific restriction endonuclease McrA